MTNLLQLIILSIAISIICFSSINAQDAVILEFDKPEFIIKGKKTIEEDELLSHTGVNESEIFDRQVLDNSILRLKKFYFDNGFFDAEIDTNVMIDYDDEIVLVKYRITENKHYKVDTIFYNGLQNISTDASAKLVKLKEFKSKDFYNKAKIIKHTNQIVDMLQNNGYMNARLRTDSGTVIKRDNNTPEKSISVILSFEGADTVYTFGKTDIKIEKNMYGVSEEMLRKVITFKEGEMYDKRKKLETERNISKYAIVQSARLEPTNIKGTTADFTAKVLLNKKNEIVPYIEGTNIENYFFVGGGARFIDKYFLGGGRVLTVDGGALINSLDVNRLELSTTVTQPNIFNLKTVLSDKLTFGIYNLETYKNYYFGNLTSLNYFISNQTFYNTAFLDLNLEYVMFQYDIDTTANLNVLHSFLSTTFVHDNTDNVLSPSRGFYHSITAGNAGLLAKLIVHSFSDLYYSQFFKIYLNNRFFFNTSSIIPSSVFATKFIVGDIIEYGSGDRLIPVQPIYKFFSGGTNSLRGWNAKENGILEVKPQGGKFLLEGSMEIRNRLFPRAIDFAKNIKTAFFLDYGNVWESHSDFRFDQIAMDIGMGFRYELFVGPIRVDFGFRLYDPQAPEGQKWLFDNARIFKDKFRVHFGIGEAF